MSSTTPDESRLLLENIVADYNVADDTISISSFDPDLDRTPFFLTLHEKTPAEKGDPKSDDGQGRYQARLQ